MGICFSWSLLSIFLPCKPKITYEGTSYPSLGWLVPFVYCGAGVDGYIFRQKNNAHPVKGERYRLRYSFQY